jgi:hypothetical protein
VSGRYWERRSAGKANAIARDVPGKMLPPVSAALADHLDRTERLLVELNHADSADRSENAQIQLEAHELLAANRLYRMTASHTGDSALASALDRLEGVLAEISNDPNLTVQDLKQVREQMDTEGILFEIRVLIARKPYRTTMQNHRQGATI